jgi:hypothetical protein
VAGLNCATSNKVIPTNGDEPVAQFFVCFHLFTFFQDVLVAVTLLFEQKPKIASFLQTSKTKTVLLRIELFVCKTIVRLRVVR